MRDAYCSIHVAKRGFEQLVGKYACSIVKPEKTMVGEDRAYTKQVCVEDSFLAQRGQTSVTMNKLDVFA